LVKDTENMLKEFLAHTTADALKHLLETRKAQGHWDDIRATSLAAWALRDLAADLKERESCSRCLEVVQDALPWIYGLAKEEDWGRSWESEAWDTSLAIIALSGSEKHADRVDQAVAWLKELRTNRGVWYDEIWETTLCAVALINAWKAKKGPRKDLAHDLQRIIDWLIDIPPKASGEFVNPHYSGFIIWLYAETVDHGFLDSLRQRPECNCFEEMVRRAAAWALGRAKTDPSALWSDDTFSNSYIAYALSRSTEHLHFSPTHVAPAIHWFRQRRGRHGGFEDTEDTALAILAMAAMARLRRWDLGHYLDPVFSSALPSPNPLPAADPVFLVHGRNHAVRDQINLFLSRDLGLDVKLMSTEASAGRSFPEKFEEIARRCSFAVCLLTADDEYSLPDGSTRHRARQNVILEIGYFWGAMGRRNKVVFLVDPCLELPSDMCGLGCIELTPDLGETRLRLRSELVQAGLVPGD
jgi:hypothetical protein